MRITAAELARWREVIQTVAEYGETDDMHALAGELFEKFIALQEWERNELCPACGAAKQ